MKKNVLLMGVSALSFLFSAKISAQVPTASFSINQNTICVGTSVQITDLSSDTPTAWSYTLEGAPATSTLQNPSLSFTAAGVYDITLVATNNDGDSAPFTQSVVVNALPNVSTGPSIGVCFGGSVILSGSGADTYTWTSGVIDGVSFVPSATNVYTVTGTDANGCENETTQVVIVNALPVLTVSSNTSVCVGDALVQTVSGADTYTWAAGGNNTTLIDTPLTNTTYTVSGTNTLTGCSNTITNMITVNPLPIVSVNSGFVCSGTSFTMNPSGAASYSFSNGSNTVSPVTNSSYTVTGLDGNGCAAYAVSDVTVYTLPIISVNSGSICAGSAFTMVPTGALSYTFSNGSNIVSPATNSSYSITGTDSNGCESNIAAVSSVTVIATPVISVNSGTICSGSVFTLIPNGAITYTFSSGSNMVSPATTTNYSVSGTSANGCVSSADAIAAVTVLSLPIISVNSGVVCAGNVFTINPTGASTYTFSNGSSTVSPLANTSYSITGTSAAGCISANPAISNVTVNALPTVSVNSGTICAGTLFTLIPNGAATYTVSGGSTTVSPLINTSYSVTGTDAAGCLSANTAISNLTVNALPVLLLNGNTSICNGSSTSLLASGASTYTWNTGTISSSIAVSPVTNTTYSVTGVDANGCSNSISQLVTVNPLPTITVNSGAVCPGFSFTLNPSGASTYTITGGSAIVFPTSTTSYSISGTNANGCTSSIPAISTVSVVNTLTLTVSGISTICNGQTTSLTASGASSYTWNSTITSSTISVNPSVTTNYTVFGTSGTCSNSAIVSVSVNPLPTISLSSTSNTICAGESASLTATGANSFAWSSGQNTPLIIITPTITTNFIVTGVDLNSCSNTATISQIVSECTGVAKQKNNSFEFTTYPNPNTGNFIIELTQETSVTISNTIGQVVYTANLQNGKNQISIDNQTNGVYFVQLKQGNQTKTVKVVKN